MLIASLPNGHRVEADRGLPDGRRYACPQCAQEVILKRGRVKVAHFAHAPGVSCAWASESLSHLRAKRVLADQFRAIGYTVELEEQYANVGRRVDVSVTVPTGHRVAIEVQDSAISVNEMERRNAADRLSGFFATTWVFTSSRSPRLLAASRDAEVRVPNEMLWMSARFGQGLFIIDEREHRIWRCMLHSVTREREWEGDCRLYTLRSTKTVARIETGFALTARRSKYSKPDSPEWTVVFTRPPFGTLDQRL